MNEDRTARRGAFGAARVALVAADLVAIGVVVAVAATSHLGGAATALLVGVAVLLALAAVLAVATGQPRHRVVGHAPRGDVDHLDVDVAARADAAHLDADVAAHADADDATKAAVRGAQKIARQLHQLLAASIAVAGLRSETDVLVRLAGSVRSVFDADGAVVTLDAGPAAPLQVVAVRNEETTWGQAAPTGSPSIPSSLRDAVAPRREGEWLVVPMLVRRGEARGVIAARRDQGAGFSDDDVEVLTLLAQMASSALDASEMNRTILSSEERWRVLVQTAPVGIVETDLDGQVRWWNRAAGTLFAWPVFDDAAVQEASFPETAVPILRGLWAEVGSGSSVVGRDLPGVELAGRHRDLTASAALLASAAGGPNSILTLVDDVTDHLQLMEELRHAQRMEVIGQLSSSVAHDFNNLLTLIAGYAELLDHEVGEDDRAGQLIDDIQATTTRASTLTGKLLTMGRTKTPTPVVFSPAAVIGSIAEVLDRVIGSGVALTLALDPAAGHVRADADQFEQTILNLATNARDAMPMGGALGISMDPVTLGPPACDELGLPAGRYVEIQVTDTGEGMDEETRLRCFDPLFTTKGPTKGTGLGLPAARRVVTESGGAIRCTSAVGKGTSFEIFLPVVDEPVTAAAAVSSPMRPMASATVLLAEDEEGIRRMVARVLAHSGLTVLEADSGEQAIKVASEHEGRIDLLVSDVVMQGMTGRELAGVLQAERPELLVVLVSGNIDSTVLDDLVEGSASFLAKPFRPSELVDVVADLRAKHAADPATVVRRG